MSSRSTDRRKHSSIAAVSTTLLSVLGGINYDELNDELVSSSHLNYDEATVSTSQSASTSESHDGCDNEIVVLDPANSFIVNSSLFSPIVGFTKKFRRKTAACLLPFFTASSTSFAKLRSLWNAVDSATTHRFFRQHFLVEKLKASNVSNCGILIYERYIRRLIRRNHYLIRQILIIFLFSIFLIASTSSESLNHARLNEEERRLIRKLFLKKFGLERLNERINEAEYLNTGRRSLQRIPDYIWDDYYNNEFNTVRHYFPTLANGFEEVRSSDGVKRYNQSLYFDLNMNYHETMNNLFKIEFRMSTENMRVGCYFDRPSVSYAAVGSNRRKSCGLLKLRYGNLQRSKAIMHDQKWISFNMPLSVLSDTNINLTLEYERSFEAPNVTQPALRIQDQSLVLFFDDFGGELHSRRNRGKRSNAKMHKRRKHRKHTTPIDVNECKRTSLYVDFGELNWQDWIIAPVGYEAYQCRGRCTHPMPSHLNTTNHAIVQSLINSIDPNAVPPPTCVPVEMSAISILYRDINNVVVVKTYPDMRVESCGCH